MADEPNSAVAVAEPPSSTDSGVPSEGQAPREASTPAAQADWKEHAKSLSREDLMAFLNEHPEGASIKESLGQSHADKVLLKDRERIAHEVKWQAERDAQEAAWQTKWNNMPREQKAEWMLQNQEMQEQHARTIGSWWVNQSKSVKEAIPELKGKSIEEWEGYFQKYPESWGQTMAALVEEVVKERLTKELESKVPAQAKIMAEAKTKEMVGKTLAAGGEPDLRSAGGTPAGGEKEFVKAYATGASNDHAAGKQWLDRVLKGA